MKKIGFLMASILVFTTILGSALVSADEISLVVAEPALAANESSVTASESSVVTSLTTVSNESSIASAAAGSIGWSASINGAGRYGKITSTSSGESLLSVYYNNGDGVWKIWDINMPGTGWINNSGSLDFYMNLGWQYKIREASYSGYSALGTIKNYL